MCWTDTAWSTGGWQSRLFLVHVGCPLGLLRKQSVDLNKQSRLLFWDFQNLDCLPSNFILLTVTEATRKDLKMLLSNLLLTSQKLWPIDLDSGIKQNSHDLFDRHCWGQFNVRFFSLQSCLYSSHRCWWLYHIRENHKLESPTSAITPSQFLWDNLIVDNSCT